MASVRTGQISIIETAHGPIECALIGAGPPVLVLHGTPGGCDQGQALTRILALQGYRVIAPSRPGYLGTRLAVAQEPEAQADAYAALLDALKVRRAAVIALSGGGIFAAQFALRHPARVARLIFLQAITAQLDISADDLFHAALLLPRSTRIAPSVITLALHRHQPSLIPAALAMAWSTLPVAGKRSGVLNDTMHISALPDYPLQQIAAPTLLIHGTSDRNVPYEQSVSAAAAIPAARLLTVPGGTHSSALFDRTALAAIHDFLRRG